MKHFSQWLAGVAALAVLITLPGISQTTSGTISGFVEDTSHAAIPGAEVILLNEETNVMSTAKTHKDGDFIFADLQPGFFTIRVRSAGFKELQKVHLTLDAAHNLSAGHIVLQPGAVTDTVTVRAEITPIQNSSAERSAVLDSTQIENLLSVGRDAMSLLSVMPGTVGGSNAASLGTQVPPTINGVRNEYNTTTVDGIPGNVSGNANFYTTMNLDAIQQISVLQGNYQAQYGKTSGASINLVSKNGTKDFHGSLYYYNRNEAWNANSYFNKRNGQERPKYRYNTAGGTIGGPIFWPGKFNEGRNKLFFFVSVEVDPNRTPEGIKYYRVPTALERTGDFSQTYNQGTKAQTASTLIRIKDPNSSGSCSVNSAAPGAGCFPNNRIPSSRIPASQLALMKIFPLPNYTNLAISNNNYNYVTNTSAETTADQEVFRFDYFPTERLHVFFKGQRSTVNDDGFNSPTAPAPWGLKVNYQTTSPNYVLNVTYAFGPTLLNELNIGKSGWDEVQLYKNSDLDGFRLTNTGYGINALNPANNPYSLLPSLSFGGITNAAGISWNTRFPMKDHIPLYSATDNVTKIIGQHTLKFGIDAETEHYLMKEHAAMGTFSFARNTSNPYESNFAYANALLGNFYSYVEPTQLKDYNPTTKTLEWFTQDQWKATKRLTLDYGIRYSWDLPQHLQYGANFVPSLYHASDAPALYRPNTSKSAVDPTTGIATYPGVYAGLFVPNTGNTANGMLSVNTPGYPQGAYYGSGLLVAPRFGFVFDPLGDGKTVIRAGYGMFYTVRQQAGASGGMYANPPIEFKPTQYYGNVSSFQGASGLLGPSSIGSSIELRPRSPYTMNMHFGVQRILPKGMTLDIAYVGTLGRHLSDYRNINEVPYGAEFQLANQSPAGGTLSDNFFRPYPGYATINQFFFDLTSNYNSLQAKLDRRFSNGLSFGISYTYSKALDYTDSLSSQMPTYQDFYRWCYGPASWDRRHNLVANYVWSLPKASAIWSNFATRSILDHWQISGIASRISGTPDAISFSTTNGANITGGGDGARVILLGDPNRHSPHSFHQWFDTSVVQVPIAGKIATSGTAAVQGQRGNARKVNFYDPAALNFNTALFKNIPVGERVTVQFRLETYNTFNHTQFNGVDANAVFANANTNSAAQTSSTFGQLNSAASPRYLQLALRIKY